MIDGIKVTKLLAVTLMALMLNVPGLRAAYESDDPVDFTLAQLHGEQMSLTDLRGKKNRLTCQERQIYFIYNCMQYVFTSIENADKNFLLLDRFIVHLLQIS